MPASSTPRPGATDGPGPLSALERSVLAALLQGGDAAHAALRNQLAAATVLSRTHSGVGFITRIHVPAEATPVAGGATPLRLRPVRATHPQLREPAEFLLQVREGRLAVLEAFCCEGGWPADEHRFRIQPD
ncbi:MAG: hypothetical protein KJ041_05495 [Gammaproteobacteria bacterium]|nr:hypothetical protein [Gammaproteobacteria bacterium]